MAPTLLSFVSCLQGCRAYHSRPNSIQSAFDVITYEDNSQDFLTKTTARRKKSAYVRISVQAQIGYFLETPFSSVTIVFRQ
ncbi:hypothetical protein DFJ43DRAFT_1079896 [Lentinula guzmanii]|uniref:Uncharacterized protein n=1 Tax=Lentinula guzmanii TaxID=2804957 RepID=A0AA38N0F7_9AGAR|nr:hypothetical protein DFJ43DRAFT_1079896 [Lentinula guzmanii]